MRRSLKIGLLIVLGVLLMANLVVLFSGKWHIYTAVSKTYLIGQGGPDIYDIGLFSNRIVKAAPKPFLFAENIKISELPEEILTQLNSIETTSLLVVQNDTIVYEKYWGEHTASTVSNSFSAVKSMVGTLIGIAVGEGKIHSIDDKVSTYLPSFKKGKLNNITIRHLLSMSAGLSWTESGGNPFSNNAEAYYGSELEKLVLSQKAISPPGIKFNYQSGNTELLALILEKVTGKSVSEYLEEKIWLKIGASHDAYWSLDKQEGQEKAFCCLYATSRDFAKFGQLILDSGRVNNEQIIPIDYFKAMFTNENLKTEENIPNTRYGLQWWTYKDVCYARGILGQYIIIVPKKNMVIVRTGHQRMPNVDLTPAQQHNPAYLKANAEKVGHPKDLFVYLNIANLLADKKEPQYAR